MDTKILADNFVEKEARTMKIGEEILVKYFDTIPRMEHAQIVDLQTQDYEKYTAYPVWARLTTGRRKGKVQGFKYNEVELLPEIRQENTAKRIDMVDKLEGLLKGLKTNGNIRIKTCETIPDIVGEVAEIVDLQTQDMDRYTAYPVWARMATGRHKGKIYGFHYNEVELITKFNQDKTKVSKLEKQLEEILDCVTEIDAITELERAISEAKGKILSEPGQGFWEGKKPCWEMLRCPEEIRNNCPAFKYQGVPCWQIEGTYAKLHDGAQRGCNTDICHMCRVYKRWGKNKPIEIKLTGRGFNKADT